MLMSLLCLKEIYMLKIQRNIAKWSRKQFPYQSSTSKFKHFEKEVQELRDEISKSAFKLSANLPKELADCGILLFGIADLYRVDLHKEMKSKLKINKKRKWHKPDKDGVSYHKK